MFRDTYLRTFLTSKLGASILKDVRDASNGVQREVADRLLDKAARGGGKQVDSAIIDQTMANVYADRAAAAPR